MAVLASAAAERRTDVLRALRVQSRQGPEPGGDTSPGAPRQFPGPLGPHLEAQALLARLRAPQRRPRALGGLGALRRRRLFRAPGRAPRGVLGHPGLLRLPARPRRGLGLGLLLLLVGRRRLELTPRRPFYRLGVSGLRGWRPSLRARRPGPLLARRGVGAVQEGGEVAGDQGRVQRDGAREVYGPRAAAPGAVALRVPTGWLRGGDALGARAGQGPGVAGPAQQRAPPERALHRRVAARVHLHGRVPAADLAEPRGQAGAHLRQEGHELRPLVVVEVLSGHQLPVAGEGRWGRPGRGGGGSRGRVAPAAWPPAAPARYALALGGGRIRVRVRVGGARGIHVTVLHLVPEGSHKRSPGRCSLPPRPK